MFSGFKMEEFIEIHKFIPTLRNSDLRTKTQALAIYLFWLKTGKKNSYFCFYIL